MSLQLILGPSGSGKSHYLYEHIIQESLAHPDQRYLILVPEQFTMQTQKELVTRHPRHGIMNIDVLSFARLAFRVLEETGEGGRTVLDDEGKNLILRRIAGAVEPELHVLKGNLRKGGYISEVKSVLSELAQYGISPDGMEDLLDAAKDGSYLYWKLRDIQTIYRAFEAYLADRYITKEEILEALCRVMPRSRILADSVVALDGFTGFTPVQNRALGEMLAHCRKVLVTVTMDRREDPYTLEDPCSLFALSKQMVIALVRIAREKQVETEDPVCLYVEPVYRFRNRPALAFLEAELFRYRGRSCREKQENLRIYCAGSPRQEVACAAQRIRFLARTRGWRYREIAVIASDMSVYADEIQRIFAEYEIPVFLDYKRSVLQNSFVEYVRSLLAMAEQNFTYESVFRFLRSGLAGFRDEETDLLENYVRALGIRGYKKWQEKWIRRAQQTTAEELELLNHLRVRLVEKVDDLVFVLRQRKKTVRDVTTALYEFLAKEELQRQIRQQETRFSQAGELALAKEYAQIYRVVIELFDKFVKLLGEETISLREYAQLLDAGMEEARVGVIPPGLDQVVAGDVQRTRVKDVKALLFLGANDALIPGSLLGGGLLSERDRERFAREGIALAPGAREQAYIQKFYLYLLMTKPTEELDICYSKVSASGSALRPAYLVGELRRMFPGIPVFDMDAYGPEHLELVPESGLEQIIAGLRAPDRMETAAWQELYRWYQGRKSWREQLERLVSASLYHRPPDALAEATARQLYGDREMSVSRLERFVSCACAHFLTYGLQLGEREEYEFAAMDFGTVFHSALERYAEKLEKAGSGWTELPQEEQLRYIEESVEESIADYSNTVLYSTARSAYMIPRMKRMMRRTVWAMTRQLERGEFRPAGYEVRFPHGRIDRVDVCETEDKVYVKIVDYKTGSRTFDMAAFYHGLQMQLVVYMEEALRLEERRHPGKTAEPAGVFYYRIRDPIVEKESDAAKLEEAILGELRLDGLVNGSDAVICRLDREFDGSSHVIPVTRTRTGYSKASKVLTPEQFAQVLEHARRKRRELEEQMRAGRAEAAPYEMGGEAGCDYCAYRHICGFDDRIPGCGYRSLPRYTKDEVLERLEWEQGGGEGPSDKK